MNHTEHPQGGPRLPYPPEQHVTGRSAQYLRGGMTVLVIIAVIYLLTSHWLHVLDALPYVFVVGMLAMHLFGHGGHGGHGGGHGGTGERSAANGK
ncbi:DUF2933 domain-containing protein [Arthrobacter sp. CG_A4]|uniref:DUF2933 domain-containing protein n=1 Tax=Arthrobacter sp. CG_A4 TaxID=3071706 RepID=UPI002E0920B9|nr:hypothetical protein [Arthrobacter sp. CG_A4]